MPGYSYVSSQSQSQSGGVALHVNSGLTSTHRSYLGRDRIDFESIWVEVEHRNSKNYLFCCAYYHPNTNIDVFCEYLQVLLSNPAVFNKQVNSDTYTTNYVISFQSNVSHTFFISLEYLDIHPPLLTISFQILLTMKP